MRRRECISLLGGAAAWPLAARDQPLQIGRNFVHAGYDMQGDSQIGGREPAEVITIIT